MALRRFLMAVAGAAAFFVSPALAQVTAPTYTGPGGNTLVAQGVVVVNPDGTPSTNSALTDAQLRAAPVPVSAPTPLPVTSQTATYSTTGTISANGGAVDLAAPGSASALVNVSGTFTGTIVAVGCLDDACTTLGGRLLFKSGVGSIGANQIIGTGTAVNREYRIVGGGARIRVYATSWSSGTATVRIYAQPATNIVFINGPVHDADDEAVRAGRGFSASTGIVAVSNGNYLNAKFCNPAASGVNMYFVLREVNANAADGATPFEYLSFANPTTVPTTTGTISNRWVGNPTASAATFQYQMAGTNLAGGTQGPADFIPTGGHGRLTNYPAALTPGNCIGYSIGGAGGGLSAAARAAVRLVWYEESVN